MDRETLANIILDAPAPTLENLALPDPGVRKRAADALAAAIAGHLMPARDESDPDQFALPL